MMGIAKVLDLLMATATTKLDVASRDPDGSRSARRLRRTGRIPGVLYGGDGEPVSFSVDARELRVALAGSGAVVDLSIDGATATPVVLKEAQRDPVRGETTHVDLLRVRLDKPIHAVVPLELTGVDETPGVKEGGILEQLTRELNIEALPTAIPESIVHELGELNIGDTLALEAICRPRGRHIARRPGHNGGLGLGTSPTDRGGVRDRIRDRARRRVRRRVGRRPPSGGASSEE